MKSATLDRIRLEESASQAIVLALAVIAVAIAIDRTAPAGLSAAAGLSGYPRLALLSFAGLLLAFTANHVGASAKDQIAARGLHPSPMNLRAIFPDTGQIVLGFGLVLALGMGVWNVIRLRQQVEDLLGHALWLGSMVLLLTIALLPSVFQVHWAARWAPDVTSRATTTTAKGRS